MAFGGAPSSSNDISTPNALAHHLGQVSLDSSPMLPAKLSKPARNYSLRELEIMATIGTGTFGRVILVRDVPTGKYYALKVMNISEVIKLRQVQHVNSEKEILASISHPFIVNLVYTIYGNTKSTLVATWGGLKHCLVLFNYREQGHCNVYGFTLAVISTLINQFMPNQQLLMVNWTFHDNRFLYMLLDFVCGGELFAYLRAAQRFTNDMSVFYAAEIVMALDYLHSLNIIYRDLKPENILLDMQGHIKITDFGFSKRLENKRKLTYTLCGTPEYLAPEIIQGRGHGKAADWWALGILVFEMLVGYPPFFDEHPFRIYEKILSDRADFPRHVESHAKDIIKRFITHDTTKRLGCMRNGIDDVKTHKWFRSLDWDAAFQRKSKPPIVPQVTHPGDSRNFDKYPEDGWLSTPPVTESELEPFQDF